MAGQTKMIPLDKLRLDERFQHRTDGLDKGNLEKLTQLVRDGVPFKDKPRAYWDATQKCYWLPGGFHRYQARKDADKADLECEVWEGDWQKAYEYSLGENAEHGLARSDADKRKAVADAMEANRIWNFGWSNHEIARKCKCGHTLVNKMVHEMEELDSESNSDAAAPESDPAAPPPGRGDAYEDSALPEGPPDETNFRLREMVSAGRLKEPEITALRKLDAAKLDRFIRLILDPDDPMPPPAAIDCVLFHGGKRPKKPDAGKDAPKRPPVLDGTGAAVPDRLRDAFADPSLRDLIGELEAVEIMLRADSWFQRAARLCDHYGFILIDKFRENSAEAMRRLQHALENLRVGLPYAVCPKCKGEESRAKGVVCRSCRGLGHVPQHRWEELRRDAV